MVHVSSCDGKKAEVGSVIKTLEYSDAFYSIAAKTSSQNPEEWLPLLIHLRDTAAVMQYLIDDWIPLEPEDLKLTAEELMTAGTFLAAVHDLGKATPIFQQKLLIHISFLREQLCQAGLTVSCSPTEEESRRYGSHAMMGALLLEEDGCREDIAVVVASHHGSTPEMGYSEEDASGSMESHPSFFRDRQSEDRWESVQHEYIQYALNLSGCKKYEELPHLCKHTQLLLCGLVIMADWIASNINYFPLIRKGKTRFIDFDERVRDGLKHLSLPSRWIPEAKIRSNELMDKRFGFLPNTVQQMVLQAAEELQHPGLIILEAPMGCGKTEAALTLAEQLAKKNKKGGLAFFLPSQATSNAIFTRLLAWADTLENSSSLAIQLAHGMAVFNRQYLQLQHIDEEEEGQPGLGVHQFFSGNKSRLLANFVVGTIDQLLMAGLQQKHIMLRHLGLAGKVVIIDECHAYDAYMNVYLDRVLKYLREYNVPVILLSATLPAERRIGLINAYRKYPLRADEIEKLHQLSYPMLTAADGEVLSIRTAAMKESSKRIEIYLIQDEQIFEVINSVLRAHGCAGIIVNTVSRAQKLAAELKEKTEAKVILYHAQFTVSDRNGKEMEILEYVGKKSDPSGRDSVIVVGTQVLEQSLDIDFDLLISDLCPMDLLLQRIGRLQRHKRPQRPTALLQAKCLILGADTDHLDSGTVAIYGEYLLKRTLALLPAVIDIPSDIARLVQATYDETDARQQKEGSFAQEYADYDALRTLEKKKAEGYLLPFQEETRRGSQTIEGLLSRRENISEDSARAAVREGDPSIEVLLLIEKKSGHFWLPSGESISYSGTAVPDPDTALKIEGGRLRLPHRLSNRFVNEAVTLELRNHTMEKLPGWMKSPWLHDELFLILDEKHTKRLLNRYLLTYQREEGLKVIDEKNE